MVFSKILRAIKYNTGPKSATNLHFLCFQCYTFLPSEFWMKPHHTNWIVYLRFSEVINDHVNYLMYFVLNWKKYVPRNKKSLRIQRFQRARKRQREYLLCSRFAMRERIVIFTINYLFFLYIPTWKCILVAMSKKW